MTYISKVSDCEFWIWDAKIEFIFGDPLIGRVHLIGSKKRFLSVTGKFPKAYLTIKRPNA